MTALCNRPQPPPQYWYIRVELRAEGDPCALIHVRNIINSYFTPGKQWRRIRIKKGVHKYQIERIDPHGGEEVFKHSIFNSVREENIQDAIITMED